MENKGYSFWQIFGAFAIGATAGAVTALMLAPQTGAETRRKLSAIPHAVKEALAQAKNAGVEAFAQSYEEPEDGKKMPHAH